MPVASGLVDLFHRAWGQVVNKPERNKNVDFSNQHHQTLGVVFLIQLVKSAIKACRFPQKWTRMALLWNRDSFQSNRALQQFLLAQNDSILHLFLEVGAYGVTGDVLDPQPQLLFFLKVILLCDLGGRRGQRSCVTRRGNTNRMHSFWSRF